MDDNELFLRIDENVTPLPKPLKVLIDYMHNLGDSVILSMVLQIMSFIDCFYSTVNPVHIKTNTTGIICVSIWICCLIHQKLSEYGIPPGYISMTLQAVLNVICWLFVIGLILIGRYKYKHQTVGDMKEKYRTSLLLRTLNVLKTLAILSAIRNFILSTLIMLLLASVIPGNDAVGFVYNYTMTFYTILSPIFMIQRHDELKKVFLNHPKVIKVTTMSTNDTHYVPKNVVGEVLRVSNERDHHFKQMTSNWQTAPRHTNRCTDSVVIEL
ncbi:unnamed protein product [Bursaphelenchus okinawaensis]|uniref:Uncharacterized protein n=1 Tax=Bursaphelenchus okinawaensis TaxID=465554 RepID=A0A811K5U8_9BILA|nr:unnamed protein product [Bursaphelenchus okinawaensis]CAG9091963.1 unnamed protein product [Bursaphelenchus okinawaensis]